MGNSKLKIIIGILALGLAALYFLVDDETINVTPARVGVPADAFLVTLTPDGYEPAEFTITKGTTVTFVTELDKPHWPASNLHPTHEIYAAFDPLRPVPSDEAWSFTFDQVGTWNFHDHIRAYYTGTVYVED
jgi:plastocyanin